MTWTCPNCGADYPDSGIGVPREADADDMDGCKVCYISPAGTSKFVSPASLNDR